jgi:hypothetical protein
MGRMITLSMAVLMLISGPRVAFSETIRPNGSEAITPNGAEAAQSRGQSIRERGNRNFVSPEYLPPRGIPNPDAPARSQLDPGLHYVGPADGNLRSEPLFVPPGYARPMGGIPNPDAPSRRQLDPGLYYDGP